MFQDYFLKEKDDDDDEGGKYASYFHENEYIKFKYLFIVKNFTIICMRIFTSQCDSLCKYFFIIRLFLEKCFMRSQVSCIVNINTWFPFVPVESFPWIIMLKENKNREWDFKINRLCLMPYTPLNLIILLKELF